MPWNFVLVFSRTENVRIIGELCCIIFISKALEIVTLWGLANR